MGVTARDNRLFVEAVLYRYRSGIPWRDLPERFGDFRVVHLRHSRWSKSGGWERVFKTLSQDPDNEYVMIDSTIVRAHQHSSGANCHDPCGSPWMMEIRLLPCTNAVFFTRRVAAFSDECLFPH